MNTADMVTDFVIRKDWYETPMGTFETRAMADAACKRCDLLPELCVTRKVEMATVQSLLKAVNAYCGKLAEEYDFSLDFDLIAETGYKAKPGVEPSRIPEKFRWLIAFAVEGGSEGYYVHVGALIDVHSGGNYQEFGLAKTNTSESAYELAKQVSRFLTAAQWN